MKILKFSLLLIISVVMFGCQSDGNGSDGDISPIDVSGKVQGGYRHLALGVKGEPVELTVYRGDYIKFHLDDKGDPQVEYQLNIPALGVSATLQDNAGEQPYFKMKQSGKYPFVVGEQEGTIEVVELRGSNYRELSAEEAWKMTLNNPPLLLDVRTKGEFSQGHIKGAKLIPLQELQMRAGELEMYKNQPVLIYCATGNRSTTASKILLDQGYKDVMNLRMGIMGWASKGYNIQF